MQGSRVKREVEAPRHDTDDGVGFAIKRDGTSQYARVAVETVQPQAIADDCEQLVPSLLLWRENSTEGGLHTKRGEHAGGEARGVNLLGSVAAREFKPDCVVTAQRKNALEALL
jgi:hypothetical protein